MELLSILSKSFLEMVSFFCNLVMRGLGLLSMRRVGGRRNLATLKIPLAGNIPLVVEWQGRGCFRRGSVDLRIYAK